MMMGISSYVGGLMKEDELPQEQQGDAVSVQKLHCAFNCAQQALGAEWEAKKGARRFQKQSKSHLLAVQKKMARSLKRQQNNQGGQAQGQHYCVDRQDAGAFICGEDDVDIYIRINGVLQKVSAQQFTEWTRRCGIEVTYLSHLLFNDPQLLKAYGRQEPFGPQVPHGHRPPLYLEFLCEDVGWGAFARRSIAKGEIIGEYTGVVTRMGEGNAYTMFYADGDERYIIDATYFGNETRFINHSENPNCAFEFVCSAEGVRQRVFVAICDIAEGEQVLTHYGNVYWEGLTPKRL